MRQAITLLIALLWQTSTSAFEMEMGTVVVQDTFVLPAWTNVTFQRSFNTTPLVFALPSNEGSDPSTIRIRNVSTTGFEILQVEPSANDGPHVQMTTAYLAIEAGDHRFPDGTHVAAFTHTTGSFANRLISTTWDSVPYPSVFAATPAILGSIQTMNNESATPPSSASTPFMDVGIRNPGPGSTQVTLERMESIAGSIVTTERIALLAIDNAANVSFVDAFSNSVVLQSLATPRNIRGWDNGCFTNNYAVPFSTTPLAVASANSRTGNNGGWLRRCSTSSSSLGLAVDEDIDNDAERSHVPEVAGIVAASLAFHANFDVDLAVAKSFSTLSDPVNGTSNPKAIPTATIGYFIDVANSGSRSPDNDTLTITDELNADLSLCVTAACLAGGPVVLDSTGSPTPPGIALGSVEYSNDGGSSYSYVPVPDIDGYDGLVNAIRITLTGTMASIATTGTPSFQLQLAARVD